MKTDGGDPKVYSNIKDKDMNNELTSNMIVPGLFNDKN